MKYNIKFSCGHEEVMQLFGKESERRNKIEYFEEKGICKECYKERKRIESEVQAAKNGLVEREMSYREYKTCYAHCSTKPDSYNGDRKTIVVYVKESK